MEDFEVVRTRVIEALNTLYSRDASLFDDNASEWSVAHRLAVYLESLFPGWNIDCEYNRHGSGDNPKERENGQRTRPDVVIHHRERVEIEHNLLAIEMKKNISDVDVDKIREFTRPANNRRDYQYQYGLVLLLTTVPQLQWFSNGEPISNNPPLMS